MNDNSDLQIDAEIWFDAGVVWAAPHGPLEEKANHDLTLRAFAFAEEKISWRVLFDYRRAALTYDVLALNRHAEVISRLGLPPTARVGMLCRYHSADFEFWQRVLNMRGIAALVFTDGEAAVKWLLSQEPDPAAAPAAGKVAKSVLDVGMVKRQLNEFAMQRKNAPWSHKVADFTELVECLVTLAAQHGVDLRQTIKRLSSHNEES